MSHIIQNVDLIGSGLQVLVVRTYGASLANWEFLALNSRLALNCITLKESLNYFWKWEEVIEKFWIEKFWIEKFWI